MKVTEEWKDIPGYENIYLASTLGQIRNSKTGKILKQYNAFGYLKVGLYKNRKLKTYLVHRLIGLTFIPNPDNLPLINHKSEIRTENFVENLEWCTAKYNSNYGTAILRRVENQRKPVLLFTKSGIFVREYYSIADAHKAFNPKCDYPATGIIGQVLQGKRKSAYGFYWKFKEE